MCRFYKARGLRNINKDFELYNANCFDIIGNIKEKRIDLILTDMPYGVTANKWDVAVDLGQLWVNFKRIIKENGVIALTATQPFAAKLITSNKKMFRYEWIWEKNISTGFLNAHKMPLRSHEGVFIFYKKLPTYNPVLSEGAPYIKAGNRVGKGNYRYAKCRQNAVFTTNYGYRYPRSVVKIDCERGLHPTQKPVKLMEYLIKTYTNESEIVLDCFMGSGTTGVACKNLNRKFIGVELNKEYFDVAKARIGI